MFASLYIVILVLTPQAQLTKQTCDYSHNVMSGTLERQCGALQDKYKLEYICSNNKPNSLCWLEDKTI